MSDLEQELTEAFAVRQRFNQGVGATLALDAQPVGPLTPEETLVVTDEDQPRKVIEFDTLGELTNWAQTLDRMDEDSARDAIDTLAELTRESDAARWARFVAGTYGPEASDLAYEPGDPKRSDFLELVGA